MEPKWLYHGSPIPLPLLEPRQATGEQESGRLTGVYASDLREFALLFALGPAPELHHYCWKVEADQAGILRAVYFSGAPHWGGTGYLYHVPLETFTKVSEHQWVSLSPVKPFDREEIQVDDFAHLIEVRNLKGKALDPPQSSE